MATSPSENATSAPATFDVSALVKLPCWKIRRTMGIASAIETAAAGRSRNTIARAPVETVRAKPAVSPRAASREISGKSTTVTATEKRPCGSMKSRKA